MFKGTVVSLYIAPAAEAEMQMIDEAHAVPGLGLEGDRYFRQTGTFSLPQPDRELTLIESEAIEAFRSELGLEVDTGFSRRNIVTRAVALNHLVGREFLIGDVMVRGLKLCEPCKHLASISRPEVLPGLVHRGGLRAQILTEGTIRAGAVIRETGD
jgi:MOSC domain-containing protein YiiM